MRGLNRIAIYCKNGGGMDGEFILVLTFNNASFSNQTERPYNQLDNSTMKFRFLLHKGESNEKIVYFSRKLPFFCMLFRLKVEQILKEYETLQLSTG